MSLLILFALQACGAPRSHHLAQEPNSTHDINRVASKLASDLAAFMKAEGKTGFAVFPICFKGHPCFLGERLATSLQKKLCDAKPRAYAVISEAEMETILDSISIQKTDPFDQESGIPALGEFYGHRYEVSGY